MTWETVEKCLVFAEGRRIPGQSVTIYKGVRGKDFPESLLWTDEGNTGKIAALHDAGKNYVEIGEVMGISQSSAGLRVKRIEGKRALYRDWTGFIKALRDNGLDTVSLSKILNSEKDVKRLEKKGILTVGDFLSTAVSMPTKTAAYTLAPDFDKYRIEFSELTAFLKPYFPEEAKGGGGGKEKIEEFPGQLSLFDLM